MCPCAAECGRLSSSHGDVVTNAGTDTRACTRHEESLRPSRDPAVRRPELRTSRLAAAGRAQVRHRPV